LDKLLDIPDDTFKDCESETSSKESDNTSNAEATTWVKEDKTLNLGPSTGNSGGETNSI
jgi:hypothetical protein